MFGIGMQELLVILVIALLVFGPKRLPELARSLGRGLNEFRRASTDLRRTISEAAEEPRVPPPHEAPGKQAAEGSEGSGDLGAGDPAPAKPSETSRG